MSDAANAEVVADGWKRHVAAWRSSGQSQMDFCRANKLAYARFVYWRRKFDEHDEPAHMRRQRAGGFAAVVREAPIDSGLTLSLPNGLIVRGICAQNVAVVRALLDQFR